MTNRVIVYGGSRLTVPGGTTPEQAKASMAEIYPELENATPKLIGDEIHFEVKAGTKGADRVIVYGGSRLTVPGDTTPEQAKASMAEIYPELENATPSLVGNEIHFEVKAGTKGADRVIVYGGSRLTVPGDTTPEQAKASMAEIYPELENATPSLVGNEIHFEVKAGTKGN